MSAEQLEKTPQMVRAVLDCSHSENQISEQAYLLRSILDNH